MSAIWSAACWKPRLTAVKLSFSARPFDDSRGLYHADGTPTELLLPWRTTARLVGAAEYLGSLQLPHGSPNHVFAHDGQAVMAVWNKEDVTESLYLGEHVTQIDLWGRETALIEGTAESGERQHVAVGPLPVFVTGLNLAVTRWRLQCDVQPDVLENTYERRQSCECRFLNTFDQGVSRRTAVAPA